MEQVDREGKPLESGAKHNSSIKLFLSGFVAMKKSLTNIEDLHGSR
jgi:hypothetical protein